MTLQQIQTYMLWGTRSAGINYAFTGANTNATTDFVSPQNTIILANEGYASFLERTVDAKLATVVTQFLTAGANTNVGTFCSINPIPAQTAPLGSQVNCSALKVYEMTYFQQNNSNPGVSGQIEYYIPLVSSGRFRRLAGGYIRRVGNFASYPRVASQQFGERTLQFLPGLGVNGDTIQLTVCPDIVNSPGSCTAANGGALANPSDVPLLPTQFHRAIVEYGKGEIFRANGNLIEAGKCEDRFSQFVDQANEYGSAWTEGDPEQYVQDRWDADALYSPGMVVW